MSLRNGVADLIAVAHTQGEAYVLEGPWNGAVVSSDADTQYSGDDDHSVIGVYAIGDITGDGVDDFGLRQDVPDDEIGAAIVEGGSDLIDAPLSAASWASFRYSPLLSRLMTDMGSGQEYLAAQVWQVSFFVDVQEAGTYDPFEDAHHEAFSATEDGALYQAGNAGWLGAYGPSFYLTAPASPAGVNQGNCYFWKPGVNGFAKDVALGITGEAPGDGACESLSMVGDVNGDGDSDLLIGASKADVSGPDSGRAYVQYGKPSGKPGVKASGSFRDLRSHRISR